MRLKPESNTMKIDLNKPLPYVSTLLVGAAAIVCAGAAHADVTANVSVTSDYRYRAISQSRLTPAVQGGVDATQGGWYVGAWGSTIRWIRDAGGDGPVELDIYGGYKGSINEALAYDVGVLHYQYPSHGLTVSPNTTELYAALTYGVATVKYSHSVSNLFGFERSRGSSYVELATAHDLGDGYTLTPHVGYQRVQNNGSASYADVSLAISREFRGVLLSATATYANVDRVDDRPAYASPSGKNLGRAAVVLAAKYTF